MRKKEFQDYHKFSDADMILIDKLLKLFRGKIVYIESKPLSKISLDNKQKKDYTCIRK